MWKKQAAVELRPLYPICGTPLYIPLLQMKEKSRNRVNERHGDRTRPYVANDLMCDLICEHPSLLQMMCRFGIPLGVGEKTVGEVCEAHRVDVDTFLVVANYLAFGAESVSREAGKVSVEALMDYLGKAHDYFLRFQLPAIRRKLIESIDCSPDNQVAYLILKFYDEYMGEVRRHMQFENRKVFAYVRGLMEGRLSADFHIDRFSRSHEGIDRNLQELKNIIIKYYPPAEGPTDALCAVLFDIFNCEKDLRQHCEVEDFLFVPAVRLLEQQPMLSAAEPKDSAPVAAEVLSEREREIVACIVRGASNKEVAERLFISVNTVLTHRKNISRKLNIHSVSGLTIYAIVHGLVDLNNV